ncbi:hypothetical protein [Bacteroides heparinolyticus]|uniref:hypothetical protein n=1 Tax=Prevotella heparinolytica TaxID=28113 RepID=UPI0023F0A367|nr:hypothetical protein [Bacteroides heparinolyticus]
MKIIRNDILPFRGFRAINLFGILFVRGDHEIDEILINHERIHSVQMRETGYALFYLWYFIEWLVRLALPGDAYRNIGFEREAYTNQTDLSYLERREPFSWVKYIKSK